MPWTGPCPSTDGSWMPCAPGAVTWLGCMPPHTSVGWRAGSRRAPTGSEPRASGDLAWSAVDALGGPGQDLRPLAVGQLGEQREQRVRARSQIEGPRGDGPVAAEQQAVRPEGLQGELDGPPQLCRVLVPGAAGGQPGQLRDGAGPCGEGAQLPFPAVHPRLVAQ